MNHDDLYKAIQYLRKERERIEQVIRMLEEVSEGKPRRGRPPKFLSKLKKDYSSAKPFKPGSA